jgi:hypothetical protein
MRSLKSAGWVNENNEPASSGEEHDVFGISDDEEVKANDDERCYETVFVYLLEFTNSPQLRIFVGLLISCKCRSIYCGRSQSQVTTWLSHDPYVTSHDPI